MSVQHRQSPLPQILDVRGGKKRKTELRSICFSVSHLPKRIRKIPKPGLIKELWGLNGRHWREWCLQRYICTIIIMTECTRSHNAQEDYSIVSNFALYYLEHCLCVYVCVAHMHVSQSAWDEVAEGWTDREIQWMLAPLLKMQSVHVGRHQKVLS